MSNMDETVNQLQKTRLGKLFIDFAEVELRTFGAMDSLIEGVKAFGR